MHAQWEKTPSKGGISKEFPTVGGREGFAVTFRQIEPDSQWKENFSLLSGLKA